MAQFAKIDSNNIVLSVEVIDDNELKDGDGNLQDSIGIQFLTTITQHSNWIRTYKDASERKNYAVVGGTYDSSKNAFIPTKPCDSWVLDESTCRWISPIAYPDDEKFYVWDEDTTSWVETDPPPGVSK